MVWSLLCGGSLSCQEVEGVLSSGIVERLCTQIEAESSDVDVLTTLLVLDRLCRGLRSHIDNEQHSKSTSQKNEEQEDDKLSLTRRCGFALARIEKAVLMLEKRVGGKMDGDETTQNILKEVGGIMVRHFRSSIHSSKKQIGAIEIDLAAERRDMEAERETAKKAEEERQKEYVRKTRAMEEKISGRTQEALQNEGKEIALTVKEVPTKSTFVKDGKITPDEFIAAGDRLVMKNPVWAWQGGDADKKLWYLPDNKQFLKLKSIPCRVRASALAVEAKEETNNLSSEPAKEPNPSDDEEEEEEDVIFDPPSEDDCVFSIGNPYRRFDATICYDLSSLSPRLFLYGYDEDETTPLTIEQILEDLSEEYPATAATTLPHPHLGIPWTAIDTSNHSIIMKSMIDREAEAGRTLKVEQYMFFFLKFVQTICPTLEIEKTIMSE
ncbi:putative ubiquitin-like-conjugating enzyme ATG3 [Blattamonas nauphoetae]|uniref:Ubiquitin-like-conjugating enzyme ATG3 n=1 Tax=Blattamonas nauphoetae TaxID=2049346 RepID=A0ABQ9XRJ8_9EUKA|nr:putative ubiquitin-like-conjugating enzyme ATG3 [Blattamonas nauphoetae]